MRNDRFFLQRVSANPFDDVATDQLLRLLGQAWQAHHGLTLAHPSDLHIGEREFAGVREFLKHALVAPYYYGLVARVHVALEHQTPWPMPAAIVAALATRHGLDVTFVKK